MTPQLLTIILNIVLGVFLLLGFLFGLKGIKKATSSLISFIVTTIVVFLLVMPVSNWVLSLNIGGAPLNQTITNFITSILGDSLASNEVVMSIIQAIPLMIVAIVVCWLLILVVGLVLKIITNIIYRLIFGKDKKHVVEEVVIVNDVPQMTKKNVEPKKHRLLGGVVGLVHGFLLAVITFMPLVGLVNIVNDIVGTNAVMAEEYTTVLTSEGSGQGFELKPSNELIQDYLPVEYYDYAKALGDSMFAKIGKIGNLSEHTLNFVARCDINGYTIKLGEEIRAIVDAYDSLVAFATETTTETGLSDLGEIFDDLMERPENYDFSKLNTLSDKLFKSNIVNSLGVDGLLALIDSISKNETDTRLTPIFSHLKTALENYKVGNYALKDDADSLIGAFEIIAKSGLLKQVVKEKFDIDNIAVILFNALPNTQNTTSVLNDLSVKICSSNLMQKLLIEANNYGTAYLQGLMNENIKFNDDAQVVLPQINGAKEIKILSTELTPLILNAYDLYTEIKKIDFDLLKTDVYSIFDYNLYSYLLLVGEEIEIITNMNLFKESELFVSVCDALSNSEYSKYLSFNELAVSSNIINQFQQIGTAIAYLKSSEIIPTLRSEIPATQEDVLNIIIDELASKDEIDTTLATKIITPLLSCSILKNTGIYALQEVNTILESTLQGMVKGEEQVVISEFNTSNFMTETDNLQLLAIINSIIDYAKDINVYDFTSNKMVDTILNSNLIKLGTALDSIKFSTLFSSNGTNTGAYNDIISAMSKTEVGETLYLEPTKEPTFSWSTTLTALNSMIVNLNEITIDNVGLVKYMIKGGDFNKALDVLNSTNVQNLKPLFEISIVRPVAIKVVNTINSLIKELVGEELGVNIVEIPTTTDLTLQAQEITDVISATLDVDFETLDDIEVINDLLAKLEINAKNNGVFTESYNALLLKIINTINSEIQTFVGKDAGEKITKISEYVNVLEYSANINSVLNKALDIVPSLQSVELKGIDTTVLFSLIDEFKNNASIANGVFAETYNSLLVYMVNTINVEIANYVETNLAMEIVIYKGSTNMTAKYNYIREIVERGVEAFKAVPDGGDLKDIASEILTNFLDALNSTEYTKPAYNALNNKLANVVIENINSLIGSTNPLITSVKNLTLQADDIRQVVDIALDVVQEFEGCSFKLEEMTKQQKKGAVALMNALQTNSQKTDSVFAETYKSLIRKIETENSMSENFIMETVAENGIVDWQTFIIG